MKKTASGVAAFALICILTAAAIFMFLPGPDRSASYRIDGGETEIVIELFHAHPFLAEYERRLVLISSEEVIAQADLFFDSGGYAEADLFRLSPDEFYLVDAANLWQISVDSQSLTVMESEEILLDRRMKYLGRFKGAGSKPWRFVAAGKEEWTPLRRLKGG